MTGTAPPARATRFDPVRVRASVPILSRRVHGKPLVYLDNAATTQKPVEVLEALDAYYRTRNANVHRGVHRLSAEATAAHDAARETVRRFLRAADVREIVFTRGTTEAINLVAQAWGRAQLRPGDEILVTTMEHHSNLVPWQLIAAERGAVVRAAPVHDDGSLDLGGLRALLSPRTKLVALAHVSNALGTINPVAEVVRAAHDAGALVVVDGAQAVAHGPVDVVALGADFYAFSGHKVFGPTGIGVLYGRYDLLAAMPPWQGGGDMIRTVSFSGSTWAEPPARFEAGTPDIAGAVGLAAAIDWLTALPSDEVAAHEADLLAYGTQRLLEVDGLTLVGTAAKKTSVLSFVLDGVHPHDVGTLLDLEGVAVRTGHHCAQPLMERFGVPATTRASFALYNLRDDVDALVAALAKVRTLFPRA